MATLQFLCGGFGLPINNLAGSGLGFFGPGGFGTSVPVGQYQSSTFVTNGNGTAQGPQSNNCSYVHPNSGTVQNSTVLNLQNISNYQSTLNIHFTHTSPVRTQNAQLYIYDRVSTSNAPSGVTAAVVPVIHPDTVQNANGSGSLAWEFPTGSSYVFMSRYNNGGGFSPGQSGYGVNGISTIDQVHDWYALLSLSPNSIGAKTQVGLFFQTEYL